MRLLSFSTVPCSTGPHTHTHPAEAPIEWDVQLIGKEVDPRTNSYVTRENLDSVLVRVVAVPFFLLLYAFSLCYSLVTPSCYSCYSFLLTPFSLCLLFCQRTLPRRVAAGQRAGARQRCARCVVRIADAGWRAFAQQRRPAACASSIT